LFLTSAKSLESRFYGILIKQLNTQWHQEVKPAPNDLLQVPLAINQPAANLHTSHTKIMTPYDLRYKLFQEARTILQ
jgi:hypothetical protein